LKTSRLLPYLIALVLLAWVLGSLARSGTAGGSILSNSTWLVYAIELLPVIALGLILIFVVSLIANWRLLADALGSGMTRRRRAQGRKSLKLQLIIWMATWATAIVYLEVKCHGLVCSTANANQTISQIKSVAAGTGPLPPLPILGAVVSFASFLDTNVFALAFFGVLVISSVIMARAVMVHLEETRNERIERVEAAQEQGREAVQAAIRVLDDEAEGDARARILACYRKMVKAASDLGAPVGPDKTARELELGIRNMFLLKGSGIARLTELFEEARYSLHPITWEDAGMARECLVEINEELGRTVSLEA
jgi:heme exporter protein D